MKGLHLHVDCASGAAGDMMLGALLDVGVPRGVVDAALVVVGIDPRRLGSARVMKRGIAAIDVKVDTRVDHDHHDHGFVHVHDHGDDHGHDHDHGHAHYAEIRKRVEKLEGETRVRALAIFDRLARAEAKLHGTSVEAVAFHEVGAIDSIVDIVGTAAALAWLSPSAVTCTSVAMGSGTLTCAHGVLPVPAPAALEVMRDAGGVMVDGGVAREMCTPTGAAILATTVTAWTPAPLGVARAVGWGAGDMEFPDRANVLRLTVLAPAASAAPAPAAHADDVIQIDANLDDMSPELCAPALDAIFAAGALDAWWTPITMKKGRPALMLSALVEPGGRAAVTAAILRETTTIGVRFAPRAREILAREIRTVPTRYGAIPVKLARDAAGALANAAPEFDACAAAAKAHGVPVKLVFAAAIAAVAADDAT